MLAFFSNRIFAALLLTLCGLYSSHAIAIESIHVAGLFPGKAVVVIDGQHTVIAKGKTKRGVRFVSANGEIVKLEVEGVVKDFQLGVAVSTQFTKPESFSKTLYANKRGMFWTTGNINGQVVRFLVDTGATTVAMSAVQAKKLKLQYRIDGVETTASTASGIAKAYRIKLNKVNVGAIIQHNVDALVIEGAYPREALLGMSFLNKLKVEKNGAVMTLHSK